MIILWLVLHRYEFTGISMRQWKLGIIFFLLNIG
jgi:hypothetical protein